MLKKSLAVAFLFFYYWCSYCQQDSAVPTNVPAVNTSPNTSPATRQGDNAADEIEKKGFDSANTINVEYSATYEYQKKHPDILYASKADSYKPSLIISFLLIFGIGISLLYTTSLCKDQSVDPKTNALRPINERSYSYSRMQLFWWTMIILSCYVAFYLYTGILVALTPTMVILLGGGIAVSLLGKVMDDSQIQQDRKPDVQNNSISSNVPVRHQDIQPSQGLFKDILSDEGGVSIHRFQAIVFNIVFGLGFITTFIANIQDEKQLFPFFEFEGWQLTLLGVSSAGYLSFKANENSNATRLERQIEAAADPTPPAALPSQVRAAEQAGNFVEPPTPSNSFISLQQTLRERGLLR